MATGLGGARVPYISAVFLVFLPPALGLLTQGAWKEEEERSRVVQKHRCRPGAGEQGGQPVHEVFLECANVPVSDVGRHAWGEGIFRRNIWP